MNVIYKTVGLFILFFTQAKTVYLGKIEDFEN